MSEFDSSQFHMSSIYSEPEQDSSKNSTISATSKVSQIQFNRAQIQLYAKITDLTRQYQHKIVEMRGMYIQAHRRCLEHIQILLFQQDYTQALCKIDQYKKNQLNDAQLTMKNNCPTQQKQDVITKMLQNQKYTFDQQKSIINNSFASLQTKQKIWLKYAFDCQDYDTVQLRHVSYEQVEQAMIEHFKREFDISSEITQARQPHMLTTPEKKNYKSVSFLKSNAKQKSNHQPYLEVTPAPHQKSAGKITSAKKKSSQKRTTRKKANKQPQESKTNKKLTPFVA